MRRVAGVIAPGTAASAATADRAIDLAARFIDLVLAPPLMRALLGEAVAPLLASAPARIAAAIAMLRASRALDGWR